MPPNRDPVSQRETRRSFVLGVVNGALFSLGSVFIDPSTVLALFVAAITGSDAFVGLIAAIASLGPMLPQIFMASRAAGVGRKMVYYNLSFAIRAVALFGMILGVALAGGSMASLAGLVMVTFAIYSFGSGLAYIPFMEVIGNTLRPNQRSSFFAYRSFFGGILAIAGGYLVKVILSSQGIQFPRNYLVLFIVGWVFCFLAMLSFSFVREPVVHQAPRQVPFRETIKDARGILSDDVAYRRYLLVRCVLALAGMSGPFYVLHAVRELGLGEASVGVLIMSMTVGGVVSNLAWGRIGDARGTRVVILAGALLLASAPLTALLSAYLGARAAAVMTFLLLGLANAGVYIGVTNYLLDHCEPASRAVYMGLSNVVVGLFGATPVIGGFVSQALGYEVLFLASLVGALVAALAAFSLPEPRKMAEMRFPTQVRYF
mgnify:CR=1 FL=1